jgi:hypothetical protein
VINQSNFLVDKLKRLHDDSGNQYPASDSRQEQAKAPPRIQQWRFQPG